MFIARKLKKKNICEYLLYMWQMEDMIRAFNLNIDVINERIIAQYPVSEDDRKSLYDWYESLIEMMRLENVQTDGHLQLNKNIIIELDELHGLLIRSGKEAGYAAKFYHVLPFVSQLRKQQDNPQISDIELCFNFQYGIMLLRMKKAEITAETLQAQTEISKFMVLLAKNYQLYKSGELDLEE
ncbi:MAG: DUF4924 family protein [Bacteroidota bacterium]|nr:DUF4924 family protein [Bacteroidota bacterium]